MFLQTYQGWPFQVQVRRCQSFPVCLLKILWIPISLSYVRCPHVGPLLVKDEYDFDNQQSHSSSESHLQTIQHPPSRPGPQEPFSSPSLLPPSEGSSSASTSAFSTISAGPSSETLHIHAKHNERYTLCSVCNKHLFLVFNFKIWCTAQTSSWYRFGNTTLFYLYSQILPQIGAETAASPLRCLNIRTGIYSIIHPCLTQGITVSEQKTWKSFLQSSSWKQSISFQMSTHV